MKILAFIFLILESSLVFSQSQIFSETPVFVNGEEGYECFRIPAIIRNANGSLLAFSEGRTHGCDDFGNLDIVMKISTDSGSTWSSLQIVVDNDEFQAGNPAPVLDMLDPNYPDGRILLMYNTGNNHESEVRKGNGVREVWVIYSEDHGKTWTGKTNISDQVHPFRILENEAIDSPKSWRSYANSPGHAIQLNHGEHQGRIYVPANHSEGEPQNKFNDYKAHGYFSDDHGKTWKLSDVINIPSSNESIAVELRSGVIMQNIREQSGMHKRRLVALSSDGGISWDSTYFDNELIDPVCQASIINLLLPDGEEAILFSNPASENERINMTIRMSMDDGRTWPISRTLNEKKAAYSDLVIQKNGMIGLLYERGNNGGIHYAKFNLDWLLNGSKL